MLVLKHLFGYGHDLNQKRKITEMEYNNIGKDPYSIKVYNNILYQNQL